MSHKPHMHLKRVLIITTYWEPTCQEAIARQGREAGWLISHASTLEETRTAFARPLDGVLGVFLNAYTDIATLVKRKGLPVVDLFRDTRTPPFPRVLADHRAAGHMAAEHFLERAFRHFAFMGARLTAPGQNEFPSAFTERLRQAGYTPALLDLDPYIDTPHEFRRQDAIREWLIRLPRPLALVCHHDEWAAEAFSACQAAGLNVPADVAILGCGNTVSVCRSVATPLSSVDTNETGRGQAAVDLLTRLMAGHLPPTAPLVIPPTGVVTRLSTDITALEDRQIAASVAYIRRHCDNPRFCIGQVSIAMGISTRTLQRKCFEHLHHGPAEEIQRVRLTRLEHRLRSSPPSIPLTSLLADGGFRTLAHLRASVQKHRHTTLRAWRQNIQTSCEPGPSAAESTTTRDRNAKRILFYVDWRNFDRPDLLPRLYSHHAWHFRVWRDTRRNYPKQVPFDGGLVMLRNEEQALAKAFARSHTPVVALSDHGPANTLLRVIPDYIAAGALAAEALTRQGRNQFAIVCYRRRLWPDRELITGFTLALSRLLPQVPRVRIIETHALAQPVSHIEKELRHLPRPVGIFCTSDLLALETLDASRDGHWMIPEELAIVGCGNDVQICERAILPLSSVDLNLEIQFQQAAELLDRLMRGKRGRLPKGMRPILIPPKGIVVRVSTELMSVPDKRLQSALLTIRRQFNNPQLTIANIAESAGISLTTLNSLFRQHLDRGVAEHLRNVRLLQVKALQSQGHTFTETARLCGFATPDNLRRILNRIKTHKA